jgi:DNA-binding response OmpR family regulator
MKVLLVQWDVTAAKQRAERLRAAGHEVLCESEDGAEAYRKARHERPDVVVLDLAHKPSHSWQTARPLAKGKTPPALIFVAGNQAAKNRAAKEAPSARFVSDTGLERALAEP